MVALALGGNLGDPEARFHAAIDALRSYLNGLRVGPLFESAALGGCPQPDYTNTALVGTTQASPEELMAIAKRLEQHAGRIAGPRHAPRPLDIDLLLYGELQLDRPELVLPHPGLRTRSFVLVPLAALLPELPLPPDGRSVRTLAAELGARPPRLRPVAWRQPPRGCD